MVLKKEAFEPTPFKECRLFNFHSLCIQRKQKFNRKSNLYCFEDNVEAHQSIRVFAKKVCRTPFCAIRGRVSLIDLSSSLIENFENIFESSSNSIISNISNDAKLRNAENLDLKLDSFISRIKNMKLYLGVCFRNENVQFHIPNKDDRGFTDALDQQKSLKDDDDLHSMLNSNGFFSKLGMVEMLNRITPTDTLVSVELQPQEENQMEISHVGPKEFLLNSDSIFCFTTLSNHMNFRPFTDILGAKNCYSLSFSLFTKSEDQKMIRVSNPIGNFRLIMTHSGAKPLYTNYSLTQCSDLKTYREIISYIKDAKRKEDKRKKVKSPINSGISLQKSQVKKNYSNQYDDNSLSISEKSSEGSNSMHHEYSHKKISPPLIIDSNLRGFKDERISHANRMDSIYPKQDLSLRFESNQVFLRNNQDKHAFMNSFPSRMMTLQSNTNGGLLNVQSFNHDTSQIGSNVFGFSTSIGQENQLSHHPNHEQNPILMSTRANSSLYTYNGDIPRNISIEKIQRTNSENFPFGMLPVNTYYNNESIQARSINANFPIQLKQVHNSYLDPSIMQHANAIHREHSVISQQIITENSSMIHVNNISNTSPRDGVYSNGNESIIDKTANRESSNIKFVFQNRHGEEANSFNKISSKYPIINTQSLETTTHVAKQEPAQLPTFNELLIAIQNNNTSTRLGHWGAQH